MDKEKAIQILKRCEAESHCEHYKRHYCCIGCGQREALDLAIEALKGDLHCPKCGTIVRDGRLINDLAYRGEAEVTHAKRTETHGVCSDCISRQAVFYILENKMIDRPLASDRWVIRDIGKAIESLPPVEQKPVCEDAIRCYEFLKERIGSGITDNAEEFEKWFERMAWHVQKCNEHYTEEVRNVSEDTISRQAAIEALQGRK